MLGRPPLEFDDRLVRAARAHSREMLELRYFAHESPTPGLRTPGERARAAGFAGSCGENIASHGDPDAAFDGWVHSPGHHRNLVGARWRQLGVGNAAAERRSSFTMLLGNGDSLRGRKH
jgi:uncharacterized protein YkwD